MSTWQQTQTPYGSGAGMFILIIVQYFLLELIFNAILNCKYGNITVRIK